MDPPPFGVRRGSTEPRGGSPSTAQINPALDVGSTLVPLQTPGGLLTSLNGAKFDPKIKQLLKCWASSSSAQLYGHMIVPTSHLQAADPKFPPPTRHQPPNSPQNILAIPPQPHKPQEPSFSSFFPRFPQGTEPKTPQNLFMRPDLRPQKADACSERGPGPKAPVEKRLGLTIPPEIVILTLLNIKTL